MSAKYLFLLVILNLFLYTFARLHRKEDINWISFDVTNLIRSIILFTFQEMCENKILIGKGRREITKLQNPNYSLHFKINKQTMETRLLKEILENEYINRKNNFKKQRAHP